MKVDSMKLKAWVEKESGRWLPGLGELELPYMIAGNTWVQ